MQRKITDEEIQDLLGGTQKGQLLKNKQAYIYLTCVFFIAIQFFFGLSFSWIGFVIFSAIIIGIMKSDSLFYRKIDYRKRERKKINIDFSKYKNANEIKSSIDEKIELENKIDDAINNINKMKSDEKSFEEKVLAVKNMKQEMKQIESRLKKWKIKF